MTVSGLTTIRAERQPDRHRDSQTPQASIHVIQSNSLRPLTALENRQQMTPCDDFALRSGLGREA